MAIYDLGTASLSANGEVTGVGTTWKAPLTLIRVGATIVFKTEPVKIYTISEIISDTQINVYNPNSETVPAGTGYAILAHDGITVQGLAQDVAETLRYYQSRETEVSTAVDIFKDFDQDKFSNDVNQVNTQFGEIAAIGAQVSSDAAQVSLDKNAADASAASAKADKEAAATSAQEAANYAASLNTENLLRKDLNFSDVADKSLARDNLGLTSTSGASYIGTSSGRNVQAEFDILKMGYKTPDDFGAKGDGSTDDTNAILDAFSWASTNGLPLRIPCKTYVWNGDDIPYDNVAIIGDKRPYADSGLTRLLGGSIFIGTLSFSGKNVQISNIGVDHGSFRFPSTAGDALIVSATGKSGQYAAIRNCIGLGRNPTDAFHAILCEGYKYSIAEDCIGIQNTYSLANKSGYSIINNIISRNSSTGVIVKSDSAFGDASFSNITNITIDGNENCNIGLWVFAQDAQLQKVNVSNIVTSGCKYDMVVQPDTGIINEININNLASSGASIASLALVANAADKIYTVNISNISAGEVTGRIIDAQATNLLNISNVNGRVTSSSTHVNDSIKIGPLVGVSNLVNITPTLNYDLASQAGVTFNNAFDKNSISNVRAAIYGSGAPRPGYATQDASGAYGVLSARYSQTNSSFIKLTLPSGSAEVATISTTASNGSVIPEGYVLWIQNVTNGQNLTITPSAAGHIVTTGNTPKVLAGGDKVGFMFDGNVWIQM